MRSIFNLQFTIYNKFLIFIFAFLILFVSPAFAQTQSSAVSNQLPARIATQSVAGGPPTSYQLSTYNQGPHVASMAIYNFSHAMSCILIGQSPIAPCLEYKLVKDATGMVKSVPYLNSTNTSNGLLGVSLSMVGEVISTPPVHSSLFIANLGEQIGIKSAHAQVGGSGSGVLAPIFKLWEVSRNISYLVMILIFVGVGLMVMFRQKLNPQTVVSVQLALPGLVIGLVMITFSYFLAALISDLAFVGTNLVGYYFSLAQPPLPSGGQPSPVGLPLTVGGTEQNALSIFSQFTNVLKQNDIRIATDTIWESLKNKQAGPTDVDAQKALEIVSTMVVTQFLSPFGNLGGFKTKVVTTLVPGIVAFAFERAFISMSLSFVAALILIYSMFKLLLRLIQNLLSIIFLTIAAPFYFLATSLPGKQGLLPNWFFNMLCNVLAFPAVFGVFYFVAFILGSGNPSQELFPVGAGSGSLAGASTFPLMGGLTSNFLNSLLAFGALVALPSIPDIICRAVGKPGQLGALAAGAVGGAIAAGQRYQGQTGQAIGSIPGHTGRFTDTTAYQVTKEDPVTGEREYSIDRYKSQAGLYSRFQTWRERRRQKKSNTSPTP